MATQVSAAERNRSDDQDGDEQAEFLELLGDEYTRRVLRAVTEQPRSGSDVVDATDVSKATAYRRLRALEEAGLVDSEMVFDPDGHHHERFHAVVEAIDIALGPDGASISIETEGADTDEPPGHSRRV